MLSMGELRSEDKSPSNTVGGFLNPKDSFKTGRKSLKYIFYSPRLAASVVLTSPKISLSVR